MISKSIKVTFVGASNSGKTSICNRLIYGNYGNPTQATVGVSFLKYYYNDISYDLWDTAGQERYIALTPMYFRNSHIVLFVFDVDYFASINAIDKYITMLENLLHSYKIIVIGNKIDLTVEKDSTEIEDLAREKFRRLSIGNNVDSFIFVSAKTGDGFDQLKDRLDRCAFDIKQYINNLDKGVNLNDGEDTRQCICL